MGRGRYSHRRRTRRAKPRADVPDKEGPTITIRADGQPTYIIRPERFDMDVVRDYVDITTFGDTNTEYIAGRRKYTITAWE